MTRRDQPGPGREYKSIRRKLEFQTGVSPRNHHIGGRALTTNELTLAYTPDPVKRCLPR
jgi:hypothetical protein